MASRLVSPGRRGRGESQKSKSAEGLGKRETENLQPLAHFSYRRLPYLSLEVQQTQQPAWLLGFPAIGSATSNATKCNNATFRPYKRKAVLQEATEITERCSAIIRFGSSASR